MDATVTTLLYAALPLVSSAITGVLVHLAHSRHLDIHIDSARLAPDVLRCVTDLVEAARGKFVGHLPTLEADAEKIVADLHVTAPVAAAVPGEPAKAA